MKLPILLSSALAALALAGCATDVTVTSPEPGASRFELRETTRVPTDEGALGVEVGTNTLRITYPGEAPPFAIGEVVYGREVPGFLRRVVFVERNGSQVTLTTIPAEIGDAFDMIELNQRVAVQPDPAALALTATSHRAEMVVGGETWTADISYGAPVEVPTDRAISRSFSWVFPDLSVTINDPSGRVALTLAADALRVEKTLTLDTLVNFHWFQLTELRFVTEDDTRATLEGLSVSVTGTLPLELTVPIFSSPAVATVPLGPLVFTVGAKVDLGLSAVLQASARIDAASGVGFHTWRKLGFRWANNQLTPIEDSTTEVDTDLGAITTTVSPLKVDAALSVNGAVNFMLYGVIGPEVWGKITPLIASMQFTTTGVDTTLKAHATGGLRLTLPGFPIPNAELSFGEWNHEYGTFHNDF